MPWPKGKKRSAATREKIAQASRDRWSDPEYRARMSAIKKKSWQDPEMAERYVAPRRGQKRSAETRAKMSESRRKRRGGHTDPELIKRMNEARRGSKNTPEHRAAISAAKKKWHKDNPELSQKLITEATKANKYHDNKLEQKMARILDDLGIKYRKQGRVSGLAKPHCYHKWDFRLLDANILIEVDGCFWHGCPKHSSDERRAELGESTKKEMDRDVEADLFDWVVLRFWEHELNDAPGDVARCVMGAVNRVAEVAA